MTQILDRDVVAALSEVKSFCSESVYELLDMVLNNQARMIASQISQIERLQRDNMALLEKMGSAYFNVLTDGQKAILDEIGHTEGNA